MEEKSKAPNPNPNPNPNPQPCFKTLLSDLYRTELASTRQSRKIQKLNTGANDDDSESLSDILDSEVSKYLNNKKEARYKRLIWEAMNKDHQKESNQKRARKATKNDPTKEVVQPACKMDNEKRLSSKINYDKLNKLNSALQDGVQKMDNGKNIDSHCGHDVVMQLNNAKFNSKAYNSGNNDDDGIGHESDGCVDAYSSQDYCGSIEFENDEDGCIYNEDDYGEY